MDTATPTQFIFIVVGAFYMFASIVAGRAVLSEAVLDAALAGITGKPIDKRDVERSIWMLFSASIVGLSGALLGIGSAWAAFVFALSCGLQVLHFWVMSPYRYDVIDPVSPEGRAQSLNAFWLYCFVTLLVVFGAWSGALTPLGLLGAFGIKLALSLWAILLVCAIVWLLRLEKQMLKQRPSFFDDDEA